MLQRDEHLISVRSHSFGEIDHRLAAHFDRVAEELVRRGELKLRSSSPCRGVLDFSTIAARLVEGAPANCGGSGIQNRETAASMH
jgi:hypothetical protein